MNSYKWYPPQGNQPTCIYEWLERLAQTNPDAIAITAPGRAALTYRRLQNQVNDVVAQLHSNGLGRHDRVAIALPNSPEMAVAFLAVASGATCAPLNPAYRANEFDFYLKDLNAKALIVQSGINSQAIAVAQAKGIPIIEISPQLEAEAGIFTLTGSKVNNPISSGFAQANDVALVLHTSGTTSRPKLVPLTHENLCTSAHNIRVALSLSKGDRCLNIMPLFHIHGLIGALLSSLIAGGSVVCTPGFYAPKFFEWVEEFRPTWYTAVPTMHQAILARAHAHRQTISQYPVRFIRSSSASLPHQVMTELTQVFNAPVIEAYGMTEASHQITSNPLPPGERKLGSVGVAAGTEVGIMDEMGNLLAAGEIGEVVITGTNVTLGYENNPSANESAFTMGWFRTGDLGYLDTDGYLFLKGRIKEIINRGGEKISPREVDEVLLDHPAIAQAVTFAAPHTLLGEDVAAAVVLRQGASATELEIKEFAAARLADFKVPRVVLFLDEIPTGATGKLHRIGLAQKLGLTASNPTSPRPIFTPPRTPLEEELAKIWSVVLQVEPVGIHDNFFQLGGDSILATQILNRVREAVQVDLSLLVFFQQPTVANIAINITSLLVEKTQSEEISDLLDIRRIKNRDSAPLSFSQARMYFLDQLEPGNPAYNRPTYVRLKGFLNIAVLEQSLNEIVRRHEILRTTFPVVNGQHVAAIAPTLTLTLPILDLSSLSATEREAEAKRIALQEAQQSFNLSQSPLLKAIILRLSEVEHILLLTMHHIIFDGWSQGVLLQELAQIYEAFSMGKPSPLPELPIQYVDFAHWQRQQLQGEIQQSQLAYWKKQLSGSLPVLDLPKDRPRGAVQTFHGAKLVSVLPKDLSESLQALSQQQEVTLFMTLLAAFKILLHRYTGQDDILVGSPVAGRNRIETEKLIGVLINTLVLRTHVHGKLSFRELLAQVREVALQAYAHQDIPFEKLVEELQPERHLNHTPVFQVMFQFRNFPNEVVEFSGIQIEEFKFDREIAQFDLTLDILHTPVGLACQFEYNSDLFDAVTIKRMSGHFQNLLSAIVENPAATVGELPLLSAAERHQLLVEWNDTAAVYPTDKCIHQLFEQQVELTPDAVAVVFEEQQLTYHQLNTRANQLAHHLLSLGVGPEVLVGICTERSVEMVVGLLGILKAGGAYVPLDPTYPQERLSYMLADSHLLILLTQQHLLKQLSSPHQIQTICLEEDWQNFADYSDDNPCSKTKSDNLAYVIYTSGSTGKPKGTMILHRGMVNYLSWCTKAYNVATGDGSTVNSSIAFDATILSLFSPLLVGRKVVLLPEEGEMEELKAALCSGNKFSLVKFTPTQLEILSHLFTNELVSIQTQAFIIGGEALSEKLISFWRKQAPVTKLINQYGPTETVAGCCCYKVVKQSFPGAYIPIGRPISNTELYILDNNLQPVPIGVPGELHIGGAGLARGYLNRPELTSEKFIANPFSQQEGTRVYKTGDLARYLQDGNIEFLGRIDHQVKIRGYRIELGEIEAVLSQHPVVFQTVVIAREDIVGDKRLVAYIVVKPQQNLPNLSELRSFLKQQLPEYMVPAAFVTLDTIPLTPNGKIDRSALPIPDRVDREQEYIAPRTPTEEIIANTFASVLGVQNVGIHDNFFTLGGHSLLATQVISRLRQTFSVELSLHRLFKEPTVAKLAASIDKILYTVKKLQELTKSNLLEDTEEIEL
ncbi:non-ribosomal peptide synthetase [Iningainema tapete]|uniref:Amino acid adenylation domain-containing protein n=1 Tax=Iningainema tapete BLCC-T55 TaxID=2748662 RepID=A0A8J6XEZ9_9CYAN|nr:non-ribosomal peptide synthetase [Iningainema tapete]MBD2771550.1 amino acid adenylation domain-containing protein [Iningainema tapete BLCC-T55]